MNQPWLYMYPPSRSPFLPPSPPDPKGVLKTTDCIPSLPVKVVSGSDCQKLGYAACVLIAR